ncbi:MAG: phenylalanine--tRNA ligase subunit beta [Patescibacteria group bacterium]|nr:phenylalanine--tRNA ligase subunit beta [Patescibacteria group bacterium]
MVFSYNILQSFFKKKLPKAEKLAEILNLHFFEVEEVEKQGNDFAIDIDVLPNRGSDCFSHSGIAREISALLNFQLKEPEVKIQETDNNTSDFIKLQVSSKKDCDRYTVKVINDVKVGSSPGWIKERLKVLGLKSINNIVDIVNYVMLETGQPLHAFDLEKITDRKIIVRRAQKRERITTLDNERYALDENILVIADNRRPIAIAGIKGGKKTEIDRKTKNIVLESANFNAKTVRKGSKTIDLKTDASWRFEHGIDLNLTEIAINRAAYLIQEIAKGKVCKGLVDFYPKKPVAGKIKLDLDYIQSLLGVKIPVSRIKNILKKLGFNILKSSDSQFLIGVPTFRLDISIPEDIIEEVGRIYGYENIKPSFPIGALIPPKINFNVFWKNKIKDILKEIGFNELYNYSFVSKKQGAMFGYDVSDMLELENPLSDNYQYLRPSLVPNILKVFKENQKNFKNIKIFELGNIFLKKRKTEEKRMLTGVMSGDSFYEMKGIVDAFLNKLGISDIWYDEYEATPEDSKKSIWHPKKVAEIKVGQDEIGFLGEISSSILEELKIESKVVVFDFDFEKLRKLASEEAEFVPISPYPSAVRDIAVLVPRGVLVEKVLNKINVIGGNLIKDIDLFDIYEGEEMPEGKKNLAFHIIYQAQDKTLSSKEIDEIQTQIIKSLDKDPDWEVRK